MIAQFDLPVYLMNDQPTTCPKCGLRTVIIADLYHTNLKAAIHICENEKYIFVEQYDEDFEDIIME